MPPARRRWRWRPSPAVPAGPEAGRLRRPRPLLKWRLASDRGAIEQPNAAGDGDAPLNAAFWLGIVLTGVAAGLFGDAMMALLFSVQHLAFNYSSGTLKHAVERASDPRRLISLLLAGVAGGWRGTCCGGSPRARSQKSMTPSGGGTHACRSADAWVPVSSPSWSSAWAHLSDVSRRRS